MGVIKKLLSLTKPGIVFGNVIPTISAFFFASSNNNYYIAFWVVLGTALVIASGCALNNYIDQDIDKLMDRTKNRVLATESLPPWIALVFGAMLGVSGLLILYNINFLTAFCALFGLFFYVVVYTIFAKRKTIYATHIGSISGAMPPVIGYCAVTNTIDLACIIFFLILVVWQIPHSFAINIFRAEDFKKAAIPTFVSEKGIETVKIHILIYILLFTITGLLFTIFGYLGISYAIVMLILGVNWSIASIKGFKVTNNILWARKIFIISIINIVITCISIAVC
jgi:protoheme IX farnesyltransferase